MPDAEGKRVTVISSDGDPIAKLRLRKDSIRVYDESMMPLGSFSRGSQIVFRPLGAPALEMRQKPDGSVSWGSEFHLEPMNNAWAIYENNVNLVGYVEYAKDHGWSFRETYDAQRRWRVDGENVMVGGVIECSVQTSSATAELLLGLCLPGLSVPARVALALWMAQTTPA